jgi:hypothetical protein
MRLILFYTWLLVFCIGQAVLVLTFFYLTYLLTHTLDFFAWGSSKADRFFLIILPFRLIPIIVVVSIIKFFVTMKLQTPLQLPTVYKWNFVVAIASGMICHFLLGVDATWWAFTLSGTITIAIVIETLWLSRRLWIGNLSSDWGTRLGG